MYNQPTELFGDSYWYAGPNLWEPTVITALKDLCKPGSIVFDVGGNMGGVTSVISRLVGPRGTVCTFEASPRIIGHLQSNVSKQGHNNVFVYHRAVFSRSNEIVMIYDGDHLNDSIYIENSCSKSGTPIKTIALDDFCRSSGIWPDIIKMDIEGAEFDALNGSLCIIDAIRPHIILEQQPHDSRCFELLTTKNYIAIDLANYRELGKVDDFKSCSPISNILFCHKDKLSEVPYNLPIYKSLVYRLISSDFAANHLNGYTSDNIVLDKGRYIICMDFIAAGTDNNMMCGLRIDGNNIFRYHGYSKLLADSYKDWVIDVPRRGTASIYFDFHDNTRDDSLVINQAMIFKMDSVKPSLWPSLVLD